MPRFTRSGFVAPRSGFVALCLAFAALSPSLCAQTTGEVTQSGPTTDTSVIDRDGTAHITRVVPLPAALSREAHARWSKQVSDAAGKLATIQERRSAVDTWQNGTKLTSAAVYPVKITEGQQIGGVPVRLVDPLPEAGIGPAAGEGSACDPFHFSAMHGAAESSGNRQCVSRSSALHPDRVLLCLHGGGFAVDSGSYTESIPIANLTRTRVVSVLYRLIPEHAYPAALEDAVAVYQALLKVYKPSKIVIYGTSAGALLTAEVAVRLKELHLPQPAALGVFSGMGDLTALGDSAGLYTLEGLSGHMDVPQANPDHHSISPEYTTTHDPHEPVLSPNLADLRGLAPTLFITSSRDMLLSGTVNMQRAWSRDSVPTQLVVFDGLPHAFWNDVSLPESREAYATMARFFSEQMTR